MAVEKEIVIAHKYGLHARPAMEFVQLAKKFASTVKILKADDAADGKSILEVMSLGAERGTRVTLIVDGDDESAAADALANLLLNDSDES
jgi:phosphocarrier protein